MNDLTIRFYEEGDRENVVLLWQSCGLVVPQNDPHLDIDRKVREDPGGFFVGELNGALVASCMAGYDGHRGWINYLAVHPHHQRRGLATLIMSEAENLLRKRGCPKINLQVRDTNQAVIAFYQSLGFQTDPVVSLGKRLVSDQ